jgi:hypothetical protein
MDQLKRELPQEKFHTVQALLKQYRQVSFVCWVVGYFVGLCMWQDEALRLQDMLDTVAGKGISNGGHAATSDRTRR